MRKILVGAGFIAASLLIAYVYLAWENNRSVNAPDQAQIESTLEKSIVWLEEKRETILENGNPMLWKIIQQAAEISDDPRLKSLFSAFSQRYLGDPRYSIWRPLFYPGLWVPVRVENLANLPYYNRHFVYAALCDSDLAQVPDIAEQNDPAFCDQHPATPACVTHQLMGIRLLQRSECGDAEQLDAIANSLQQRIRRQLQLDPRVVDVYMQRVLMLVESGAGDLVRPVWVQNLIDAQQGDGGWSPFEPLAPLMGGQYFGYGSRLFSVSQPRSDFHMTAQGVLLFTLLSNHM